MHYYLKEHWGIYTAAICGTISALGAFNIINAFIAMCIGVAGFVLVCYKINRRRIQKEKDDVEINYLYKHRNNEDFMRAWVLKRQETGNKNEQETD